MNQKKREISTDNLNHLTNILGIIIPIIRINDHHCK